MMNSCYHAAIYIALWRLEKDPEKEISQREDRQSLTKRQTMCERDLIHALPNTQTDQCNKLKQQLERPMTPEKDIF